MKLISKLSSIELLFKTEIPLLSQPISRGEILHSFHHLLPNPLDHYLVLHYPHHSPLPIKLSLLGIPVNFLATKPGVAHTHPITTCSQLNLQERRGVASKQVTRAIITEDDGTSEEHDYLVYEELKIGKDMRRDEDLVRVMSWITVKNNS